MPSCNEGEGGGGGGMRIVAEMERCTRMAAHVDEVAKFAARFGRHLVLPERYTRVAIIRDPGFRRSLGRQAAKQRSPLYRWNMMVFVRAREREANFR